MLAAGVMKDQCIDANELAQDLRREGKRLEAGARRMVCSHRAVPRPCETIASSGSALSMMREIVRRGGIEPPTRGFSVRQEFTEPPEKNAVPDVPRGGFGAVTDPDEAVRTAIKAAVDAGRLDLAARLLDVLRKAPKLGAVVGLETAKGRR